MLRKRLTLVLVFAVVLASVAALAGCSTAQQNNPTSAPPASTPVDKGAIVKEATVAYLGSLPDTNYMVDPNDALKDLASYTVYDLRKPEDFAKGHLKGATNIPFGKLGASLDQLPKDKQLLMVCYGGLTGSQATALLRLNGYKAFVLKGGMTAWTNGKLPVEQ